jgi:hypothetical protein
MKAPITILSAVAAILAATLALAQDRGVARLRDLKGNILLSQQSGLAAGSEATRLPERTRVITTAGSEVVVVYDNGCEVRLQENQRFEVVTDKACSALFAESLFGPPVAPPVTATGIGNLVIPVGGAAILIEILKGGSTKPLSPS